MILIGCLREPAFRSFPKHRIQTPEVPDGRAVWIDKSGDFELTFERFGARLAEDLPGLLEGDAAAFHAYAFATVRMAGASFELLADHLRWQRRMHDLCVYRGGGSREPRLYGAVRVV